MIKRSETLLLAVVLMMITIVGVAAFQGYWLRKLYLEEWSTLKRESDIAFRDIVYQLQSQRQGGNKGFVGDTRFSMVLMDTGSKIMATSVKALKDTFTGHVDRRINVLQAQVQHFLGESDVEHPMIIRYVISQDSTGARTTSEEVFSAYQKALLKSGVTVPFRIDKIPAAVVEMKKPIAARELKTGYLFVGLNTSFAYQASLENPFPYIVRRLRLPITVGVLLLAITTLSLIFLYRNLVQQRQISAIKNEFISNMTHELKTPISTVTVAVEALRHFGALEDPAKAREYLDISALELQRLSLLVDKVLKLSLFENRQIELKPERIDVPALVAEVMASMKLSFEKAGAVVQLNSEGDGLFVRADRMHLASVISNLLDNALKYSRERPAVGIVLSREGDVLRLAVTDNGIGIPPAYCDKIFEKFFRVPSGDHHNIKGYGLGLSYVHHIVTRHAGDITVESKEGRGSTFIIQLPAA